MSSLQWAGRGTPNQHAQVYRCHCAVGARRPPACDRHETGLSLCLGAGRGVVVLARSHRIARTDRDASTHAAPTVYSYYQFVRSLSRLARARLLSVSYGQHEFLECAPCTSTVVVRNTERYGMEKCTLWSSTLFAYLSEFDRRYGLVNRLLTVRFTTFVC